MPKETQTAQGSLFQCYDFHADISQDGGSCQWSSRNRTQIVFRIALPLLTSFTHPPTPQSCKSNPVSVTTEEVNDEECIAVFIGPVSATRDPTNVVTSTNNNNNIIKPVQTHVTEPLKAFVLPSNTLLYQTSILDSAALFNNRNI